MPLCDKCTNDPKNDLELQSQTYATYVLPVLQGIKFYFISLYY